MNSVLVKICDDVIAEKFWSPASRRWFFANLKDRGDGGKSILAMNADQVKKEFQRVAGKSFDKMDWTDHHNTVMKMVNRAAGKDASIEAKAKIAHHIELAILPKETTKDFNAYLSRFKSVANIYGKSSIPSVKDIAGAVTDVLAGRKKLGLSLRDALPTGRMLHGLDILGIR